MDLITTRRLLPTDTPDLAPRWGFAALTIAAAMVLGVAVAVGVPQTYLIAGLISPFVLMLTFARPSWAVSIYVVMVYADVLSTLTLYEGLPAVARFAGIILAGSVLCYRLLIRRGALAADEMTWWMLAYAILLALGLGYARNTDAVMTNLIEFVRNFLTYFVVINTINTPARLRRVLWLLLGVAVALSLITIYQSTTGNVQNNFGGFSRYRVSEITAGSDAARPGGPLGDANYFGQMLLIFVPLAIYFALEGRKLLPRLLGVGATASLILAIVYTYSRGDALALFGMIGLIALYKKLNPGYIVGGIVALILVLQILPAGYADRLTTVVSTVQGDQQTIYNEASLKGRAGASEAAIAIFLDHPILGVGRENYTLYQLEYLAGTSLASQAKAIPPHDLYLEVAAEHGLVGIAVVGGLLLMAIGALLEARRRFFAAGDQANGELAVWMLIGFIGYLISSLFLHGAYLYMLWLQVTVIIAMRQIARRTTALSDIEVPPLFSTGMLNPATLARLRQRRKAENP